MKKQYSSKAGNLQAHEDGGGGGVEARLMLGVSWGHGC